MIKLALAAAAALWSWQPAGALRLQSSNSSTFRVPYRLSDTNQILVRARIDGHGPFTFILDTGAPALFISKETAAACGIKPDAESWGKIGRMLIEGGPALDEMKVRIEDPAPLRRMNTMQIMGAKLDGVMGYTLLARFLISLDLTSPTMIWTDLHRVPAEPASLKELTKDKPLPPPPAASKNFEGMADQATAMMARLKPATIAARAFFGVTLDEAADGPRVSKVLPDSPAGQAGFKPGDLLLRVVPPEGQPISVHSVKEFTAAVADAIAGQLYMITVKRSGTQRNLTIRPLAGGL